MRFSGITVTGRIRSNYDMLQGSNITNRRTMMRTLNLVVMAVVSLAIVGCSTAAKQIQIKSQGERSDIFTEVRAGEAVPKGYADIIIKSSLQTHLEGHYAVESVKSLHGKKGHPFVINVDGQAAVWEVTGIKENPDKKDRSPESGEGLRYTLEKRIRLNPGMHTLFFGIPGENQYVEFSLTVDEGQVCTVEAKPAYNRYRHEGPRFERGVARIEVFLNGNKVQ